MIKLRFVWVVWFSLSITFGAVFGSAKLWVADIDVSVMDEVFLDQRQGYYIPVQLEFSFLQDDSIYFMTVSPSLDRQFEFTDLTSSVELVTQKRDLVSDMSNSFLRYARFDDQVLPYEIFKYKESVLRPIDGPESIVSQDDYFQLDTSLGQLVDNYYILCRNY